MMTSSQKEQIIGLRSQGASYGQISLLLGIPVGTVKTFFHRHSATPEIRCCSQCGGTLVNTAHKRKKRFCSDQCRMEWWKAHASEVNRALSYNHICEECGREFQSHKTTSHFCSRACYAAFRRKAVTE